MGNQHSSSSSSSSGRTGKLALAAATGIAAAVLAWNWKRGFFHRSSNALSLFAFNFCIFHLSSFTFKGWGRGDARWVGSPFQKPPPHKIETTNIYASNSRNLIITRLSCTVLNFYLFSLSLSQ
jgi:hypothetical protein